MTKVTTALIFNSGLGSRMNNHTEEKPKCMVRLYNNETIFERQIRILSECGIKNFIVTTGPFKEQLHEVAKKFPKLNFTFVPNENYKNTNYIVSMYNTKNLINSNILLLHGDLVFNKKLIIKLLNNPNKSVSLYNEDKPLPEKDFKGRFLNNKLIEVSINIFDKDCLTFQPLYKLVKQDIIKWLNKVEEFVLSGNVKVYAENALNEISNTLDIQGMSYKDDYIEEIDNEEDYLRVNKEIELFDQKKD